MKDFHGIPIDLDPKQWAEQPIRTQNEPPALREAISNATGWRQPATVDGWDSDGKPIKVRQDMTRQEDRDTTDLKKILANMNATDPRLARPIMNGEQNTDLELQEALHDVRAATEAFKRLPEDLKEEYPSWMHVLRGLETGNLTIDDEKGIVSTPQPPAENGREEPKPTPPPKP